MAAVETSMPFREERVRYDLLAALAAAAGAGIAAFRARRRERALLVALSRRSPRLLADMGVDAEQVYAALDGSWDEVDPARLRPGLPRRSPI
jgi:hypothetical protein